MLTSSTRFVPSFLCGLGTVLLLVGCAKVAVEKQMENAIEAKMGGNADVEIQADGQMRVETDEGTYTAGGGEVPADWPKDAPTYPDATVSYSASVNPTTGKAGSALVLVTTDDVKAVTDYYKKMLETNGWTISATMEAGATTVMGASKDDRTLSLSISGGQGQTSITMGIEKGE